MGRKQKERQKKKNNQKLLAARTSVATATSTASSGDTVGGNNSATADRSSSVVGVGVSVAAAKKGTTTESTTMATCYHGSTAENTAKGSYFRMAIDEWLTIIVINLADKNPTEILTVTSNFDVKHKELMNNPEFIKQVFALATYMFQKDYGSEEYSSFKQTLQYIIHLGIKSKYVRSPLSASREKFDKYCRDIETDRGIINVLFRETNTFCHCMKPYKEEAKAMEKVGACSGCKDEFPKMNLKRCSRCLIVQYCSKECMKKSWPTHKQFCTPHHEQTMKE